MKGYHYAVRIALAAAGLATLLGADLRAQRIENIGQGRAVRMAWAPVVQSARRSVVEVVVDSDPRVLGTVVGKDLVVTKYSELQRRAALATTAKTGEAQNAERATPDVTCRQGDRSWTCVQLAFDRPSDLVLLQLRDADLTPIEWQTTPPSPGAFLATPGMDERPLGVGMLSTAPYLHTRQRAFLGIRFADANRGPAALAEVLEHGAAQAGGLRSGDVVVGFAEQPITGPQELRSELAHRQPGDKVEVKVRRGDADLTFEVTLGSDNNAAPSNQEEIWGPLSDVRSGFGDVLQHDTVLTPADCGGPVVDLSGKAIGVNISRAGRVETLALPAVVVQRTVTRWLQERAARAGSGRDK